MGGSEGRKGEGEQGRKDGRREQGTKDGRREGKYAQL